MFSIKNLDPSLKFRLVLTMPGRKTLQTELVDPLDGALALSIQPMPEEIAAAHVISGIITQDGVPVIGALVEPHGAKAAGKRWWGRVEGVDATATDEQGRFAMIVPKDLLALDIEVTGHGFCGEQLALLKAGADPVSINVRSGASVTGKLVRDGQPAAGMSIAVVQLHGGETSVGFGGYNEGSSRGRENCRTARRQSDRRKSNRRGAGLRG